MKIAYSNYTLVGKGTFKSRRGALLKVRFEDDLLGYADCHPWPELGDVSLSVQLASLQRGILTNLTDRSLYFARIDAQARHSSRNVFENLRIPDSHWLVSDDNIPNAFTYLKFKDPQLLFSLLPTLDPMIKIRFDLNAKLSMSKCRSFLEKIQPWKERFDFIEDPIPFVEGDWKSIEEKYSVNFALDRHSDIYCYPVIIHKPAVQDTEKLCEAKRVIVTSYLDHPLGQLTAAYTASKICPNEICGLLSHQVYEENEWSEQLQISVQKLLPPEGIGFGFDKLLDVQRWEPLS